MERTVWTFSYVSIESCVSKLATGCGLVLLPNLFEYCLCCLHVFLCVSTCISPLWVSVKYTWCPTYTHVSTHYCTFPKTSCVWHLVLLNFTSQLRPRAKPGTQLWSIEPKRLTSVLVAYHVCCMRHPHSWNKTTSSRALKSIASSWGSTYHAIILFIWSQEYKAPGHRMGWSYESAWLVYRHVFTPIIQMLVWVRESVGSGRQETEVTTTTLPPWPTSYLASWSNHAESIILTPGRIRTVDVIIGSAPLMSREAWRPNVDSPSDTALPPLAPWYGSLASSAPWANVHMLDLGQFFAADTSAAARKPLAVSVRVRRSLCVWFLCRVCVCVCIIDVYIPP